MRLIIPCWLLFMAIGCATTGPVRGPRVSGDRPPVVAERSFMEAYTATHRYSAGKPASITVTPDGESVLFLRSPARSSVRDLYEFDTRTGRERKLLTAEQILQGDEEALSEEEKARRERMRLSARGIVSYKISKDGERILVPLSGRLFVVNRDGGGVRELKSDRGYPIDPKFSPDGRYVSCVRDGEVYVTDLDSGTERAITSGAGDHITHGLAEFVAQEEMSRFSGYWWSPDSRHVLYQRTDTSEVEELFIMDALRPEKQPQGSPYPRAGTTNADVTLFLTDVNGAAAKSINWDRGRYPYLATVKWRKNAPLTLVVQNRQQTEHAILAVNTDTGGTTILHVEKDGAWINLDQSMPRWLADGSGFLWTTERNGWWQLEQRDRNGDLVRALTPTDFLYKGFEHFDEKRGIVYLSGSDTPVESHLYKLAFDQVPATPERITEARGLHGATFGRSGDVYVHSASLMSGERVLDVRRVDGSTIGELRSVADEPAYMPNVELTQVGGSRKFHAAVVRPRNFDPSRKYPVIVYVYGGPRNQVVLATPYHYLRQQWFADHGFIVVSLDGRGTPARGRDWERVIKHDLIGPALDDQVAGLKALGAEYPEMDLSRVGMYGWSFGGYFSAMAVLREPDVFHVGVAGAPVTDWHDYDTHYTERYMGLPSENERGYRETSALTYAEDLRRPLLLIHGTADDNVYFLHSLKLSNELMRAGRVHDFLPLSDFTHMVADPQVSTNLYAHMVDYFVTHLYGP